MGGIDKKNPLSESSGFIKLQSELSKIIPATSGLVDGILGGENTNKLSLELSDELLQSLVEISENSGKSFNDIFNQILESGTRNVLIGTKTDTEINNLLGGISFKNLEAEVLRFIGKNNSPYSSGTEADVYKMNIPGNESEVLLVKRKYENTSENEYSLHHIAKEIQNSYSGEGESIVHVPTPLYHFNDGDNEYILMEFIKGKTLHLIISEAILGQETIHLGKEIEDEYLRKEFYYYYYCYVNPGKDLLLMDDFLNLPINQILPLLCDNDGYLKDINFTTDEEGSNALLNIYRILKQGGVKVDFNPDGLQEMGIGKYVNELTHNKINKSDLSKIALFSEKDSNAIIDSLKKFIDYMHEKGLYHLDLGANTRNIMFTKKDDGYSIDIIDFGRSIYFPEGLGYSEPYGKLAKDEEIINRIKTIGNLEGYKKIKLIDKEKEESLKDLILIGNDFGISEAQIKNKYNSYNKNLDKHNFVSKLKLIFSTRDFGGYKFILGDAVNKEKQLERDKVNNIIKSEILVQLFFIIKKGEGFEIKNYINENIKGKYKNLYIDMFEKLNQIK